MPESNEALLRQILSGQATMAAQFEALAERVDGASVDAREARDLGNKIATKLEEQNVMARLAEYRGEVRSQIEAIRTDFAAAYTRVLGNYADLVKRVEALETDRNKVVGAAAFFGWLGKAAPWLLSGIAAFAAGGGLDKLK